MNHDDGNNNDSNDNNSIKIPIAFSAHKILGTCSLPNYHSKPSPAGFGEKRHATRPVSAASRAARWLATTFLTPSPK